MSKHAIFTICILFALLVLTAFDSYSSKQSFYKAIASAESMQAQLNSITESKSLLEAENKQLLEKIAELSKASNKLKHENDEIKNAKPPLPVSISYRKAMFGAGLVAMLSTTTKQPIAITAKFENPSIGTNKTFELHLDANSATEIGHAEGFTLEIGDTITLENSNYTKAVHTVR